ncbi:2-hydroxyacid dehydrogenase [Nakamurella lactea]|uniref:2-hydroxyacid dehydrogenase n=1 Tax=Nakamurella lactea TaxID=459515 RepID=UPI00041D4457|nr:C-terminal binding protein [Nakamurella lactea]
MSSLTIAVADGALSTQAEIEQRYGGQARFVTGPMDSPDSLARTAAGADAIVVTLHRLSAEHFAALPESVRVVGRAGVGLDTIDLVAADERGTAVVYQPDYATNEVADHAAAMALSAVRLIPLADRSLRTGQWASGPQLGPILDLQEVSAGIVGAGRIGRAAGRRLRPFVREVLGYDVPGTPGSDELEMVGSLPELLSRSSIVSLHVPLTPQTRGLIGADELALLPPGAVLVNVSRGGLVDEAAVAEALHSGRLGAAALDVFETEPLADDSPLRTAPNAILTPHIAWYSSASGRRLADWTVSDVIEVALGKDPQRGRLAVRPVADPAGHPA